MSLPFQFSAQSTVVEYSPRAGLLSEMDKLARAGGEELFFGGRPDPEVLLVQSGSQSTHAIIRQDGAVLNTNYYGSYASPEAWEERQRYSTRKLKALLDLITGAGAKLTFIGITTLVRLPTRELDRPDRKKLKKAASRAFGAAPVLSEGPDCFDFSLRASRVIEPHVFSNISVNWYQTRTGAISMLAQPGSVPITGTMKIWQMTLEDEGVEIRFDRNNKHGLYNGILEWTGAEFLAIGEALSKDLPRSYDGLVKRLEAELAKEG